jgi:putative tricarboxylic transport membrane protein
MRGDMISGAVLAGLGVYIIVTARGWDYMTADGPGPGFFPLWYGIAMLVLSIVLVGTSLKRRAAAEGEAVNWREVGNAMIAWVALAASIGLLKVLGFALSFGLLTFFIVAFIYRRSLTTAFITAVGCSAGFYVLFPLALNVGLPTGVLGF